MGKNTKGRPAHLIDVLAMNHIMASLKNLRKIQEQNGCTHSLIERETGINGSSNNFVGHCILNLNDRLDWMSQTEYPQKELPGVIKNLEKLQAKFQATIKDWECHVLTVVKATSANEETLAPEVIANAFKQTIQTLSDRIEE